MVGTGYKTPIGFGSISRIKSASLFAILMRHDRIAIELRGFPLSAKVYCSDDVRNLSYK